ncbi:MAG: hypothetical protein HRU03_06915 [Nanoarchaeales archaeon]|nr:hypothetical protein [Nanoarchaeales archaeon]
METVNIHDLSINELEEHSQTVKELILVSKAKLEVLNGDLLSKSEVLEYLNR